MIKKSIQHPNGFKAVLYGKSMTVYSPEGRECLYSEDTSIQTDEEVLESLEEMPDYLEAMGIWRSDDDEEI